MRLWPWIAAFAGAGAATLIYGATVEAKRLVVERHRLRLRRWPKSLNGYRIALLADLHLCDAGSVEQGRKAVLAAMDAEPDAICLLGDHVNIWKEDSPGFIGEALEPLEDFKKLKLAIAGNHDYYLGDPSWLELIFEDLGVTFLRNESLVADGIAWVGVDSANELHANPYLPMMQLADRGGDEPIIVLWHEPDVVDWLPSGAALMVSGHSHGGQFMFPWGWTPMHTKNGRVYVKGFYPDAPTPIYVSRGVGVTGPPSRLCCPPEVSILELHAAE